MNYWFDLYFVFVTRYFCDIGFVHFIHCGVKSSCKTEMTQIKIVSFVSINGAHCNLSQYPQKCWTIKYGSYSPGTNFRMSIFNPSNAQEPSNPFEYEFMEGRNDWMARQIVSSAYCSSLVNWSVASWMSVWKLCWFIPNRTLVYLSKSQLNISTYIVGSIWLLTD